MIRNVRFLSRYSSEFKNFCAGMAELKRLGKGETVRDPQLDISNWLEDAVRQEIGHFAALLDSEVIGWEQEDCRGLARRRYKEIDAAIKTRASGRKVLVEIKASQSKCSVRSGIEQINRARELVMRSGSTFGHLLVLVDCSEICYSYAQPCSEELSTTAFAGLKRTDSIQQAVELCDQGFDTVYIASYRFLCELLDQYGDPTEEQFDFWAEI